MSVNNKHLATLLLGAAAAFAAHKYSKMSDEEKDRLSGNLKDKFNKLKNEAEGSLDTAKNYFNDLKIKAGDMLKEYFPNAEQHFHDMFDGAKTEETATAGSSATAAGSATQNGL